MKKNTKKSSIKNKNFKSKKGGKQGNVKNIVKKYDFHNINLNKFLNSELKSKELARRKVIQKIENNNNNNNKNIFKNAEIWSNN